MSGDVRLSTRDAAIEIVVTLGEMHVTISRLMTAMVHLESLMQASQAGDTARAAIIADTMSRDRALLEKNHERTFLALEDLLKRLGDAHG